MMETVVVLNDQKEWRKKERWYSFLPRFLQFPFKWITPEVMSWDELIDEMNKKMNFPGLTNAWTLPIKGRIDMLTTGIRTPVGIKISGSDRNKIEKIGIELEKIVGRMNGVRSVFAERVVGGLFFDVNFNREALSRHGISIQQAQDTFAMALGGKNISSVINGRERISVNIRYARGFRQNKEDINRILLDSPKGYSIPLSEVASIVVNKGSGMIRNDNGLITGYVYVDLTDSDVGNFVAEAKRVVAQNLSLPSGYSLSWSGQYESIQRVREKLKVVLPVTPSDHHGSHLYEYLFCHQNFHYFVGDSLFRHRCCLVALSVGLSHQYRHVGGHDRPVGGGCGNRRFHAALFGSRLSKEKETR